MVSADRSGSSSSIIDAHFDLFTSEVFKNAEPASGEGGHQLFIVCSSDKGLCGGIHSSVSKKTKAEMLKIGGSAGSAESSEGPRIIILGDKAKAQLSRSLGKNVAVSFNQVGKDIPTFADASAIADKIISSGVKFDKVCTTDDRVKAIVADVLPSSDPGQHRLQRLHLCHLVRVQDFGSLR